MYRKINRYSFTVLLVVFGILLGSTVSAQSAVTLSVTPTLFQMNADPGQVWRSSIKIVNINTFPLTVYAEPVNFRPHGEGGTGKFTPVLEIESEGTTLAEWIDLDRGAITIEPETSLEVPFIVSVPDDPSPGGHFAAIMVSTKPPDGELPSRIKTTQAVSSLFFLRIAGDVTEEGVVREFTTEQKLAQTPEIDFLLRFENTGNVHIQPQGDIRIYNMWGKERGVIPINQQTNFGNVLPESIRQFNFNWRGESAFTEIGRYRAELTLGYGQDERNFVTSATYFWIVPLKEVAIVLLLIGSFIGLIIFAVRSYVRRMLMLAGVDPRLDHTKPYRSRYAGVDDAHTVRIGRMQTVSKPVTTGLSELSERMRSSKGFSGRLRSLVGFIRAYRLFFVGLLLLIVSLSTIVWFISDARTTERAYEVTIDNPDQDITISSEEIIYREENPVSDPIRATRTIDSATSTTALKIVNVSGIPGTGASLRRYLEDRGYVVSGVSTEFERTERRTIIVFPVGSDATAVELSKRLDNALLSAVSTSTNDNITVFVGADFVE